MFFKNSKDNSDASQDNNKLIEAAVKRYTRALDMLTGMLASTPHHEAVEEREKVLEQIGEIIISMGICTPPVELDYEGPYDIQAVANALCEKGYFKTNEDALKLLSEFKSNLQTENSELAAAITKLKQLAPNDFERDITNACCDEFVKGYELYRSLTVAYYYNMVASDVSPTILASGSAFG